MTCNGLGYEWLRGLAFNLTSTHQTENPRGFSEIGENKQLLKANVVRWHFNSIYFECRSINIISCFLTFWRFRHNIPVLELPSKLLVVRHHIKPNTLHHYL